MKYIIFALPVVLFFSACSKKDDPAPASNSNNLPSTQWYSSKGFSGDTVDVTNGYLYLTSKYVSSPKATTVSTFRKIKGDFELLLKFSSFVTTGTNSTSEVFGSFLSHNYGHTATPVMSVILSNDMMYAEDSVIANTIFKSTTHREGEWYVKRTGADFTSWFRAGNDTLKFNKINYTTNDLILDFDIQSSDNTPTKTSVHIDDFTITGGGGEMVSDPFDVNNITQY